MQHAAVADIIRMSICSTRGPTHVVVEKPDLWQGESVVQGHEDSWLDQDVNQVHGCMPKEEGRSVQACISHCHVRCMYRVMDETQQKKAKVFRCVDCIMNGI